MRLRHMLVATASCMLLPLQAQDHNHLLQVTVKRSDTLIGLSRQLLISPQNWKEVARLNRLRNPDRVWPGQVLRVPLRMVRSMPAAAELVSVTGMVRIDSAVGVAGAKVLQGQRVQTDDSASAVMVMADGSRFRVTPSSLVELAMHRRYGGADPATASSNADISEGWVASSLRVLRGSVEVFATQVLRAKPLEVITPTLVIGVRGTQFRVRFDEASRAQSSYSEVVQGSVQLQGRPEAARAILLQGQGTLIDTDHEAPRIATLLKAPDLSAVPALFERAVVRFALPSTEAWRWQVASDPNFEQLVRDVRVPPGEEVRLAGLSDGQWHVRARRVDSLGIEGFDASTSFLLRARPEPPALVTPQAQAKHSVGKVRFHWAPNIQAPGVRLQVASDLQFTQLLIDQTVLNAPEASLPLDQPGIYHWRLASVGAEGQRGPFGDSQSFELRALPEPPTAGTSADGQSLVLAWSARPEDKQQVQLATNPEFTHIVAEAELTAAPWVLPKPSQGGTYYFRYRSIEPDGFTSPYSSTLSVDVPRGYGWLWVWLPVLIGIL